MKDDRLMTRRKPKPKPMLELGEYEKEARRLGEEFLAYAPERFDEHELDFTINSVRHLDRACRFSREKFDEGVILRAGFYFAEILRRNFKGTYDWEDKLNTLALKIEGLTVYPLEKVRKVVEARDAGTLPEFVLVLAKRIADQRGYGKAETPAPPD